MIAQVIASIKPGADVPEPDTTPISWTVLYMTSHRNYPFPTYLCFSYSFHNALIVVFPPASSDDTVSASRLCSPIRLHRAYSPECSSFRTSNDNTHSGSFMASMYALSTYGACLAKGVARDSAFWVSDCVPCTRAMVLVVNDSRTRERALASSTPSDCDEHIHWGCVLITISFCLDAS